VRRFSRSPRRRPSPPIRRSPKRNILNLRSRSPSVSRSRSISPGERKVSPLGANSSPSKSSSPRVRSRSPKRRLSRSPNRRIIRYRRSPSPLNEKVPLQVRDPSPNRIESPSRSPHYENSICLVDLISGVTQDQIESLILTSTHGMTSGDILQVSINENNHTALVSLSKSELVKSLLESGVILFFGKAIRIESGSNWKPTVKGRVHKKKLSFEYTSIDEFMNTLSLNRVLLDELSQHVTFSTTNVTLQVQSKSEENLLQAYKEITNLLEFNNK